MLNKLYSSIKIFITDCDGTLTDGIYQISENGGITKSFYTRDFYAIEQIMRNGIKVVIMTQSHDDIIYEQVKRILSHSDFWNNCFIEGSLIIKTAIDNKKAEIERIFEKGVLGWDNIAYIGDAENDLYCIQNAGFSGCPTDAVPHVRDEAMYPSDYRGGHGAVHDFCMHLLKKRIIEEQETEDENS